MEGLRLITVPHRVWELAIDLDEINAKPGGAANLGLRVASPASGLVIEPTRDFLQDFSQLMQVELGIGSIVQRIADPDAVISLDPNFIEITQVIQNRLNTVPLVAGKRTMARVYINVANTPNAQPVHVYLYGRRGGAELPGSPLYQSDSAPLSIQRGDATDTTLFTLPDSWASGTVEFQVRIENYFGQAQVSSTLTRAFNTRETPTIWIVPINTGTAGSPHVVSDTEIAAQEEYLRTVYPVADVTFVHQPWTALGPCSVDDAITKLREYFSQVLLGWIFGLIFTGSEPFDMPTQIYGFAPSGGGTSDPIWYFGTGHGYVARGYRGTSLEGTMAHEINHNLDRSTDGTWGRHAPFGCGATGPDSAWPYADASLPVEAEGDNSVVTITPKASQSYYRLLLVP